MPVAALQISQLCKAFGSQVVLDTLALSVAAGEFVGLVGVNGAGKTTLIKCLLDLSEPDKGNIEIFGVNHRHYRARSRLSFVPEYFAPPHHLTGRNFLDYMLRLRGQRYQAEGVEAIMLTLDLDPGGLDRPVRTYSKGMMQKLGLAACFLSERELYVLDEPMSGLDPKARALLKRHLLDLKARGRTLFFSAHSLADVNDLCDRMAILHCGEVRFVGTPAECCRRFAAPSLEQAFLRCIA